MSHLCFASFMKELLNKLVPKTGQYELGEELLYAIIYTKDLKNTKGNPLDVDDGNVSKLMNYKKQIHEKIYNESDDKAVEKAVHKKIIEIVMPKLNGLQRNDLIHNILELIKEDPEISEYTYNYFLNYSKQSDTADFLTRVFLHAIKKKNVKDTSSQPQKAPEPTRIQPPAEIDNEEMKYVQELLEVYTEALGLSETLQINDLEMNEYKDDFSDHRTYYYAAETIRRGARDCFDDKKEVDFGNLKEEIYENIKGTCRKKYDLSIERLDATMDRATQTPVNRCGALYENEWIGARVKKGVCHFLVNDGKITWKGR